MENLKAKYVDISIKLSDISDKIQEINDTMGNIYYLISDGRTEEEIAPMFKQLTLKSEQLENLSKELKCL